MTSLLSYTIPNYALKNDPGSPRHIPQPFLNYGGLTNMLNSDYKYIPKEPTYQNIPQEKSEQNKQGFVNTLFQMIQKKKEKKHPRILKKMKQ